MRFGQVPEGAPGWRNLGAPRVAPTDQHLQFVSEELGRGRSRLGRPPSEPSLGQPLLAKPVALAVVFMWSST